ncbi:related to Smad nuclear interacting protein 1 [Ustilago trichophora]|uniref:Related to Smad nuclear interacting protein 1 n=1 Tax=Ustilago trichophora TaxID=86804 RepID=A0A5C3E3S7_9BASI|nr:related to Smad nuclear interacting protein 1 [Ustilago trichophora]
MSDTAAKQNASRGDAQTSDQATSSARFGSQRETDEHRDRRSHSRRESRDRDSPRQRPSRARDSDTKAPGSLRRQRYVEESYTSKSSSKRHRDEHERDERRRTRNHNDDRHRSSREGSSRRDGKHRSHRHHRSSKSTRRNHADNPSGESSSRDHKLSPCLRSRSRSRSRSPLPTASNSSTHPPASRNISSPPSLPEPGTEEDIENDTPNFAPSGLLAAESNTVNGVALKYHEPPEARKPKSPWRLYCFKDGKDQEVLHLGAQSAYLLGRDRTVVDIPLDHESCSKQHAVVQFRQTVTTNEFGDKKKRIQPFLIDLESSNGSYVNDTEIPTSRYYQLRTGDTLTFGASTREYVLLDETSS